MSMPARVGEKRRSYSIYNDIRGPRDDDDLTCSPLDHDKKVRREIANSNERRRMQSINAGFQSLRLVIPHQDGEKLSKAAILQQTADHVRFLDQEKAKLVAQNKQLQLLLENAVCQKCEKNKESIIKREKRDTESSDEGISLSYEEHVSQEELKREIAELRCQLDRERRIRMVLEERNRIYGIQFLPERIHQAQPQPAPLLREPPVITEPRFPEVAAPAVQTPQTPKSTVADSMSKRNLETIVQAIRHLEGDSYLEHSAVRRLPQSEESERESTLPSDQETDTTSETSGRESPLAFQRTRETLLTSSGYPITRDIFHRPLPGQFFIRPNVIMHSASS